MRYAFTYFRFFGVLLGLLGLSSIAPVWGQTQPTSPTGGSGGGLPSGITIRRPCAPVQTIGGPECKGEPTTFRDATLGVKSWEWNFDSAPISGTATPGGSTSVTSYSVVQYQYQNPGTVTVTLKRTFTDPAKAPETVPFTINIGTAPPPFQDWRTDTTICKGQILELNPYPNNPPSGVTYEWAPKGEITQTLSVSASGCYSVEVTNALGCSTEDRINVKVCPEQSAQQGVKWYFGNNAGLDFSGGSPTPLDDGKLNSKEGTASISDTKGNLLFYTDGVSVYDKQGNLLPTVVFGPDGKPLTDPTTGKPVVSTAISATAPLGGSQLSTQSALIVPKGTCRGCEYQYYVYTAAEINGTRQLTYSIVDMRKNDGNGAIVDRNLPVAGTSTTALSTERSAGVKNEQDSTYWVITRDFGGNTFRITHITKDAVPTQTTVSAGASQTALGQGEGYLKIGPPPQSTTATSATGSSGTATNPGSSTADGVTRPVAMIVPGVPISGTASTNNTVELFTFNDKTGKLEYQRTIDLGPSPPKAYGVEFAPDGKSLYVTLVGDPASGTAASSYIYRYDLTITDPDQLTATRQEIATSTTQQFGALQVGPDNRIYVSIPGQSSLGVIENPNANLLDSLRFTFNGQSLGGKTGQLGLPNQVANFNENQSGAGLSHEGECHGQPTQFTIGPFCPDLKERYTVNFGDGTAPYSGTATQVPPHTYARPGSYTATLTVETFQKGPNNTFGPSCTVVTATDALTIASVPQSITLNDQNVCRLPLSTTLTVDITAQNYVWVYGGRVIGRNKTYEATRNGTYTAYAFNESPECFVKDDANVLFRQPFEPFTPSPDPVLCKGSSTTIGFAAIAPAYNTFQWSNGQNTKVATVNAAGVFSVTATHPIPGVPNEVCTSTASVTVTGRDNPTLTASTVNPKSCTSLDGSILVSPGNSGTFTYAWTGNNNPLPAVGNSLSAIGEGAYNVRITDSFSCSATADYTLRSPLNNLAITPNVRDALCSVPGSGSVSLNTSGGSPVIYAWRNLANTVISNASVLTGVDSGTFSVQVSDVNGCSAVASSIQVGLDPTGFASLGPPQDKCTGSPLVLRPVSASVVGSVYQWSSGQTTPTISVSAPGTYSVRVSNPNGCTGTASVTISDRPAPALTLAPEYRFCVGDAGSTTLTAGGPASLSFVWSRGNETGRTLSVNAVGPYSVQATDPAGCTAVAATRVVDFCEPRVFTPEAFTPNGDGKNDQFDVYSAYTTDFEIKIFNRWGEVIFASDSPEVKWDGTYRGQVYPPMMYAYVVSYKSQYDPLMPRVVRRGSVLLIR